VTPEEAEQITLHDARVRHAHAVARTEWSIRDVLTKASAVGGGGLSEEACRALLDAHGLVVDFHRERARDYRRRWNRDKDSAVVGLGAGLLGVLVGWLL